MRATRTGCRRCGELSKLLGANCDRENDRNALRRNDIEKIRLEIEKDGGMQVRY